jgi:hypothetical protein
VVDEWGNVGEKDEWGNPIEAPIRDASVPGEDIDETLECPRTVSSKVRDMPGTARGLILGGARRDGADARGARRVVDVRGHRGGAVRGDAR